MFWSVIVPVVIAAASLTVAILSNRDDLADVLGRPFRRRTATWRQFRNGVKKIEGLIQRDGYRPDVVVGIGRGGAIFAGWLAGNLTLPVAIVNWRGWRQDNVRNVEVDISVASLDVKGKSVLIAESRAKTGETCKKVKEYIESLGPRDVSIAALYREANSQIKPDYCAYDNVKSVRDPLWKSLV